MQFSITQEELLELVEQHEPAASLAPPTFRRATCVKCGKPVINMWHIWLTIGGFKKEVHLCRECGHDYER